MATTHYSELKLYALSTPFVENACCEFDVASLRPTYRLLIGIPGKSNAFAISQKLGLSKDIIEAAKEQISAEKESFEDVISNLEHSRLAIEKEQKEIEAYKKEIKALKEQLASKRDRLDDSRDKILREANEQARAILQEAKEVADETIRSMTKAGLNTVSDLERQRQKVRDQINKKNEKLAVKSSNQAPKKFLTEKDIRIGDSIKVISSGFTGTISSLPDKKGNLFVQCGIIRSQVNIKDLQLIQEEPEKKPVLQRTNTGNIKMSKSFGISPEINLLGSTVDEALAKLDKYLDDAYLAHLGSVRIVHGKGTGVLRSAVQQSLRKNKHIKSFRLGVYGEGEDGVTIAEFK